MSGSTTLFADPVLVARVFGIDGNGRIAQHGLGPRGCNRQKGRSVG